MLNLNQEIKQYGENHNVPITKDDTLDFLCKTINEENAKQILEIGTAIAFGSITMAENTNLEHIDTVEIDVERFKIANENIKDHNLQNKISTHLVDAMEYIQNCNQTYDLIYLDGPKGQYINYLPHFTLILKCGGIIIADNLHFHGMVTGEIPVSKGCRAMIRGLHKYIDEVTTNPIFETQILNVGDGVGFTRLVK